MKVLIAMTERYKVKHDNHALTTDYCPRWTTLWEHHVFLCLSHCEGFKGIADGEVVCDWKDLVKENKGNNMNVHTA